MNKVMIHPASYENVRNAVERAFALFPMDLDGKIMREHKTRRVLFRKGRFDFNKILGIL